MHRVIDRHIFAPSVDDCDAAQQVLYRSALCEPQNAAVRRRAIIIIFVTAKKGDQSSRAQPLNFRPPCGIASAGTLFQIGGVLAILLRRPDGLTARYPSLKFASQVEVYAPARRRALAPQLLQHISAARLAAVCPPSMCPPFGSLARVRLRCLRPQALTFDHRSRLTDHVSFNAVMDYQRPCRLILGQVLGKLLLP